jgi:protein involved in polysaccharide export with SLBB domain
MDDIGVVPPVQVRVERNGEIRLPMVGRVQVNDLELEDVENVIRKAYVPKFYHDVSVHAEVIQAQPTNVMVVGSVTAPGLVPLRRKGTKSPFC